MHQNGDDEEKEEGGEEGSSDDGDVVWSVRLDIYTTLGTSDKASWSTLQNTRARHKGRQAEQMEGRNKRSRL